MFMMCGGCVVMFQQKSATASREYEAKKTQWAVALPDDSTGVQWVKASKRAKEDLIERVGPSWTSVSHSDILKHVNYHYEHADNSRIAEIMNYSLSNKVRDIIAKYKKSVDDAHDARVQAHYTGAVR